MLEGTTPYQCIKMVLNVYFRFLHYENSAAINIGTKIKGAVPAYLKYFLQERGEKQDESII